METLIAQNRAPLRLPYVSMAGLLVWMALYTFTGPILETWQISPFGYSIVSCAIGLVAVCGLANWSEGFSFSLLRGLSPARRLPFLILLPLIVVWVVVGPLLLLDDALASRGLDASPVLVAITGSVWFLGAALGSFLFVALNLSASAALRTFRQRTRAMAIAMLSLTCALTIFAGPRFVALLRLTDGDGLANWTGVALDRALGARLSTTPMLHVFLRDRSGQLFFRLALLVVAVLPAVLSATRKFVEGVMERIDPLIDALDVVASGGRQVAVAEGGSAEFDRLGKHFNQMVSRLGMAERMERAFGRYTSTHVLDRIRAQHGEAELPACTREASVLFADIRGFTALSERLTPEQVVAVLNRFFSSATQVIDTHEGFLNKFVGDAIMVVFNGPVDQADHADRATRCAVALQQTVDALNAARAFDHVDSISVGIGIASGPMICGNVGGSRQMEYTVIGDVVNTASRLCSAAPGGQVWITKQTSDALSPELVSRPLPPLMVKGKVAPVAAACAWPLAATAPLLSESQTSDIDQQALN